MIGSPLRASCRWAALVALLFAAGAARASDAAANKALLARLEAAVNAGDTAALASLSAAAANPDFRWAGETRGMMGRPRPWQALLLTPPSAGQRPYVAFTRYHVVESTSDHLYPLVDTSDGPRLGEEVPVTSTGGYRVRHHNLTVRFDVPARRALLTDRFLVERQPDAPPTAIFRINAIYRVSSVSRGGAPVPYRQAGGFLAVEAADGARATYDIAYDAALQGSSEDYVLPTEAALTSYWYPHTARLPATADVQVTVPKGWTAIAEGDAAGKTVGDGTVTTTWRNPVAVCFFTVAAGRYTVTTRRVGSTDVSAYLLRPSAARAEQAISTAGNALRWFSTNFSPYPYKRYAVVESDTFPAALECYSFTLSGGRLIPMAVVHEVSHTWWGGVVPNTYTRTLWNESFAEYSDGLYGRRTGQGGMHEFNPRVLTHGLAALISTSSLMQAHDAMASADAAIGYGKGSAVLEGLERLLGTDRMLACIRRFVERHKPGEDAEWRDFVEAVKEVAGPEWEAFFPPWLERTDLPDYRLADVVATPADGRFVVTGTIRQDAPAFWSMVPIVVRTGGGDTRVDVPVKDLSASFRAVVDARPTEVALDPGSEVLRKGGDRTSPPTLMTLQTLSQRLLVVYATGGSAAESAAARAAAAVVKTVVPFAVLRVMPDVAATEAALSGASVLFLGRAGSLQIPAPWRARLPLTVTGAGMGWGGRTWRGADLWGLAIVPHPSLPAGLLVQAASVAPAALRRFRDQGELDGLQSAFVVRGSRPVASGMAPTADPSVVRLP